MQMVLVWVIQTEMLMQIQKIYVSWNWKMGTTSGLTGGTITPTSYSINATAGFGILWLTQEQVAAGTIAHGLGVAPTMMIVKKTNLVILENWYVYHKDRYLLRYMVII